MTPDDRYIDYKLFEVVASNVVMSLDFAAKSDEALEKMLLDGKDQLETAFSVAKVAWLLNRPSQAIRILEDLIQKRGNEKSGQEFNLPVNVLGNYWIATIARQYGDAERAKKAYDDILKQVVGDEKLIGQTVYCYLSKAEFEAVGLKQKNVALKTLGKIKTMSSPFGRGQDKEWNVFQECDKLCILRGR
jgi:hypothetical protein